MNKRMWLLIAIAALATLTISGVAGFGLSTSDAAAPTGVIAQAPAEQNSLPATEPGNSDPFGIRNFNCADIGLYNVDKQLNLRANAIMESCTGQKSTSTASNAAPGGQVSPDAYGGTDVSVKPAAAGLQSESFSWRNGSTVVVFYNDLTSGSTGKGSYSTDSGATFTLIPGDPFGTGHGSNFGDPAVVYDALHGKWIGTWLASGCGGQGVAAWTSSDGGATWTAGGCANVSSQDDRNSAWQDNNPSSPFYGRSYVTFNDFNIGGGALRTSHSTDGGVTWSAGVSIVGSFIRDVQLTGLPSGDLILAGMDEGGGGASNRTNKFYRSTDGGTTWSTVTQGSPYPPPGNVNCSGNSYFRVITPQIRHMGWGQPAGGPNNTVHYAYAAHGAGSDEGDIYYVRSTDSGATWSTPLKLNTDSGTRAQWMPSVGVTSAGSVFVKWYDRRDTSNNDYWIYGRASTDNGVTWQADMPVSDAVIPQPTVQTGNCYMGDYDYWQADGTSVQGSWTDSRGVGSGGSQDVFHDDIPFIVGTPTPTDTPTDTPTSTPTDTPTSTDTPVATDTPTSTDTPIATDTVIPTETPTVCTISFEDVPVGSTFYPYIQCLACQGIINGYPCGGPGEPCNGNNDPYFRPGNNVTRGQFAKIASNSAGFNEPPGAQQYEDVPVGSTFFDFVWRLSDRGYVTGYPCGGPGEPCGPNNLPYFRPNANVTRGQLSKIDANAAGFNETPGAQQYEDVAPGSTFYDYIWRLSDRGIINGYPCGGNGEPCGPNNLPYFRPGANATRGQASKIVANTFFPSCQP